MPRIRRQNLPPTLLEHLQDRVRLRETSGDDLSLRDWLDTNPEVPASDWFKTFHNFFVCGRGELIRTLLTKNQTPVGHEIV